jgi:hypothetical protein
MFFTTSADGTSAIAIDQPRPGQFAVQIQTVPEGDSGVASAIGYFSRQELEAIRDGINTALMAVKIPPFEKKEETE